MHVLHVRHVRERRQRTFIDDPLFADLPARHLGRIVLVGRITVDQASRTVSVVVLLVGREGIPVRIGHRVEVVQVSEELIEAMHRREKFVQVTEVVLAELAGGIALRLCAVARVTACAGIPTSAPACPTVVSPVRIGNSPVMKLARPAVQLASA